MANADELYEGILKRLMDAVPNDVDKREGSVIYNAIVPVALELQQVYEELEDVIKNTFADTAELEWLILRAKERGVEWLEATNAVIRANLTFDTTEVTEEPEVIGSIFALENSSLMYEVTDKVSYDSGIGIYLLTCSDEGVSGNVASGNLLIEEATDDILYENLQTAEIVSIEVSARNDEDVESLRKRYFASIESEAFGGNVADYKEKSLLLPSVGAIKVIPVWNGGGTVKLIFLNAVYDIPTQGEIDQVKNAFDPDPEGEGNGLAPIGHTVTVVAPTGVEMNIKCDGTYETGYTFEDLLPNITEACNGYFLSLRKEWESRILTISPGVLAYQIKSNVAHINTLACSINDHDSDFNIDDGEAPILGTITEA